MQIKEQAHNEFPLSMSSPREDFFPKYLSKLIVYQFI